MMTDTYKNVTTPELVSALEMAGRTPSLELIQECIARRTEITEDLLKLLAAPRQDDWADDDPRLYAAIHAGNLLISFREARAIPIFMRVIRDPDDDSLAEWFCPPLASYGAEIITALAELLQDKNAPEYPRMLMTDTLHQLALEYPTERAHVIELLKSALPKVNADGALVLQNLPHEKPNRLWSSIVTDLAVMGDVTSRPQIEALYRDKWIDEDFIGDLKDYYGYLETPRKEHSHPFNILETYQGLHQQAQREAEWRLRSEELRIKQEQSRLSQPILDPEPVQTYMPQTIRRTEPKIGRNDPCYCGSGRKYKHCHGKS